MCKDPYEASNHRNYDKQILSYLDIQDHLSMHSAYEDYRERERTEVSKPFFVCCNVTKLMAIKNEHSHVENGAGPGSTKQLHTHNGGSISGLPLTIKITQDPHHHACPIEQVIQLHDIPDLISSICRMWDLNGYDGSMMFKVPKSVELYSCSDTFSMTLDSEGAGASTATKLITVSEIQLNISLFSPEATSSVMVGTVELGFLAL